MYLFFRRLQFSSLLDKYSESFALNFNGLKSNCNAFYGSWIDHVPVGKFDSSVSDPHFRRFIFGDDVAMNVEPRTSKPTSYINDLALNR